MGVDIALFRVEQQGSSPRRRRFVRVDAYLDEGDQFVRACAEPSLPMLSRVDPYGSLILTSEEMGQFVDEVIELSAGRQVRFLEPIFWVGGSLCAGPAMELHLDDGD